MRHNGSIRPAEIRKSSQNQLGRALCSFRLVLCFLLPLCLATAATAGPLFDTSTPISFFTNVASRLLASQMNVNMAHIEVYPTNQYTPAVHRLLQVTANIWDAQNTNFYPTVFRPLFAADASNDIFIVGYQQVTGISGQSDPQLAMPYDPALVLNYASNTVPIADSNGPVNIYGVPWVLGVKQGLPNFNQLSLVSAAQITRELEVTRNSLDPATALYATNQMYVIGISNTVGVVFWNSYSNDYPRPLTVFASDTLSTTLTNGYAVWHQTMNFNSVTNVSMWPGSHWIGIPPTSTPGQSSFLTFNWPQVFLSPTAYDLSMHQFNVGTPFTPLYQLPQLDQFGLSVTNYLQAFILDGTNVIDYVQFCSPNLKGGLNQALADPNFPSPGLTYYQWSTNAYQAAIPPNIPYGAINQLLVSSHANYAPTTGSIGWSTAPTPMGATTPTAEAAYFEGFFVPTFQWAGQLYSNRQLFMQAPYAPTRTVYTSFLLQANDPLVHYLASDLSAQNADPAIWFGGQLLFNDIWYHSDNPLSQPLPVPPVDPLGGRYQPWGKRGQMAALSLVDTNLFNSAYKDPLALGPDYWNFPTGQNWNLSWLGQVHRGTPWQTIYLKSTNILSYVQRLGNQGSLNAGTNTWANWTGDLQQDAFGQYSDATASAPISDWQLVSLLAAMLNTNDLRSQFSVNNPDPNAWAIELDGMTALTNLPPVFGGSTIVPQFNAIIISSNSSQASIIVHAIQAARAGLPSQTFQNIGDVLATPQLSLQSPFLNFSNLMGVLYGINDQAYEAIPSQLLPLLRTDSIGQMISANGQMQAQFSGYDGHQYAVQLSPDLLNWTSVSTNSPTNGVFTVTIPAAGNPTPQFYRTVLVQ